jgi:hypothetical protein
MNVSRLLFRLRQTNGKEALQVVLILAVAVFFLLALKGVGRSLVDEAVPSSPSVGGHPAATHSPSGAPSHSSPGPTAAAPKPKAPATLKPGESIPSLIKDLYVSNRHFTRAELNRIREALLNLNGVAGDPLSALVLSEVDLRLGNHAEGMYYLLSAVNPVEIILGRYKMAEEAVDAAEVAVRAERRAALEEVRPNFVLGEAGPAQRKINFLPHADDPKWGLTEKHVAKHLFGNKEDAIELVDDTFALKNVDPGGNAAKWLEHLTDLARSSATATKNDGIFDVVKEFPRADGNGTFRMGVRLKPKGDGTFDLVTILTKQSGN